MKIEIIHESQYRYSDRIFLEPHIIRLIPRPHIFREVLGHSMKIDPVPDGLTETLDANGNRAYCAWFSGMTDRLIIKSKTLMEVSEENPFTFIIHPPSAQKLPMVYSAAEAHTLKAAVRGPDPLAAEVEEFARGIAQRASWETIAFVMKLSQQINAEFHYESRTGGLPHDPVQTLRTKSGSCRDFAWLCVSVCRCVGLASRFVSGYLLPQDGSHTPELHAWFEVYIPSVGWKGFDPANGIMCYQNHIILACACEPSLAAPVAGTYRGFASSHVRHFLNVNTFEPASQVQ